MGLQFEWDRRKAAANQRKHKISFEDATSAFGDSLSLTIPDPDHSREEERFILLGLSHRNKLLVVSHTERGDNIRIISARGEASRSEKDRYEEG